MTFVRLKAKLIQSNGYRNGEEVILSHYDEILSKEETLKKRRELEDHRGVFGETYQDIVTKELSDEDLQKEINYAHTTIQKAENDIECAQRKIKEKQKLLQLIEGTKSDEVYQATGVTDDGKEIDLSEKRIVGIQNKHGKTELLFHDKTALSFIAYEGLRDLQVGQMYSPCKNYWSSIAFEKKTNQK